MIKITELKYAKTPQINDTMEVVTKPFGNKNLIMEEAL